MKLTDLTREELLDLVAELQKRHQNATHTVMRYLWRVKEKRNEDFDRESVRLVNEWNDARKAYADFLSAYKTVGDIPHELLEVGVRLEKRMNDARDAYWAHESGRKGL